VPTIPIAPEPFVPEASTPAKLITVMEENTLCESVAVTVAPLNVVGANARQTSAVPNCAFVRVTKAHVRLAPVTWVTVIPADLASEEMKASRSSFADVVENEGDVMPVAALDRSVDFV
jgi:hypothetical protein